MPLSDRFSEPSGYTRVDVDPSSYAAWLRGLPVRTDRTEVRAYDDRPLERPSAAIVHLDVGMTDLQQCADTAIRLHAEYLWRTGRAHTAGYHFTSGDRSRWADWQAGERFVVSGSTVNRQREHARPNTHAAYRGWLEHLFRYAGTRSLAFDTATVPVNQPLAAGDMFVSPGSPGHTVILLDIAESAIGPRIGLIGQGFMPAEDLHVLEQHGRHTIDDVWFVLPGPQGSLTTPSWPPFPRDSAFRFPTD